MSGRRSVYVLDEDAKTCASLERLLGIKSIAVVPFHRSHEFLAKVAIFEKGCVLLDLRLPGANGVEVIEALHRIRTDLPVIAMTAEGDVQIAVRAMKAGAIDFLKKPFSEEALLTAIEAALAIGGTAVRVEEVSDAIRRVTSLSPREHEVLEALINGGSNKMIAQRLGLSVRTIEVHRARMMQRLGVRQLAEALRLGITARLGSRPSGE